MRAYDEREPTSAHLPDDLGRRSRRRDDRRDEDPRVDDYAAQLRRGRTALGAERSQLGVGELEGRFRAECILGVSGPDLLDDLQAEIPTQSVLDDRRFVATRFRGGGLRPSQHVLVEVERRLLLRHGALMFAQAPLGDVVALAEEVGIPEKLPRARVEAA